jgi:hypothetical protein
MGFVALPTGLPVFFTDHFLHIVMCPKNSSKEVFTSFVNNGGWSNIGTACLVSQVSVLYCNLGKQNSRVQLQMIDSGLQDRTVHVTFRRKWPMPPSTCRDRCGGVSF